MSEKPDVSYAPSGASFAVSFANAERGEPLLVDVARMVACIREQQAALETIARTYSYGPGEIARAALTKWRIE